MAAPHRLFPLQNKGPSFHVTSYKQTQMFQQEEGTSSLQNMSFSPQPWLMQGLQPEEDRGLYLIHLLMTCANYVASNNLESANTALDQISSLASTGGDTMQRIASYFSKALADKIIRNWSGVYKAFHSTRVSILSEEILVRNMFSECLPIMKVAFLIGNHAILEAMEGEKVIHIIDLNAVDPIRWCALIRDLNARPEGPPHLKITGIHREKQVLDHLGYALIEEAVKLDLPFQFNPVVSSLETLDFEKLGVKTGEAVAVTSVLQLHTLLACDELFSDSEASTSSSHSPGLNRFLSSVWSLSPKIMVVTEQESDHNGRHLMERVSESLFFYAALFDCLESALPRASIERLRVEKMLLGEEIKNIIASEGVERKERHEKLEKWCQRLGSAGFVNAPFSNYYALLQANKLLQSYKPGYKMKEESGGVSICWHRRPLFSTSVWTVRR